MVLTEASSSDSDADMMKLESSNGFMKLLAMSRLRHGVEQYLGEEVDEVDSRLLHGVYQKKVLTQKEIKQEPVFIIDKINTYKTIAKDESKKKKKQPPPKPFKKVDVSDFD